MKTQNSETLAYAEQLYKVYLDVLPRGARTTRDAVLLRRAACGRAPRTRRTRAWRPSSGRTRRSRSPTSSRSARSTPKLKKEAAYAAVLGWKNALAVDPRIKMQADRVRREGRRRQGRRSPKPIREREQKMLAAFDIYIKYIKDPKDEELVDDEVPQGEHLLAATTTSTRRCRSFQEIVDKHPKHETAEYSATLLLDSLNRLQKLRGAGSSSSDDARQASRSSPRRTATTCARSWPTRPCARSAAQGGREAGEGRQVPGLRPGLPRHLQHATPTAKENDEVLYNAGVCFEDAKSIGVAIQMYEHAAAAATPSRTAGAEGAGPHRQGLRRDRFYDRAAAKLEQYAKKYGGEKDASERACRTR